jgi:hypothetical protein
MVQLILSTCTASISGDIESTFRASTDDLLSQVSSHVVGLFDANREQPDSRALWLSRLPHSQQRRPIRHNHRRRQFPAG